MKYLDLTLPTPAENLACDEALLDLCEAGFDSEILRFWEPHEYFVVVGYANRVASEVNLQACVQNQIPVFRRCTGGGTVIQGPGCLNYSLILKIHEAGLQNITATNKFVLQHHRDALQPLVRAAIELQGHTDLAIKSLKFSGNSQRRKKHFLLFHGTFLLRFDIALVEKVLPMPSRQPDYRQDRAHKDFLMNLNLAANPIKAALQKIWQATEQVQSVPIDKINALAHGKYSTQQWNSRF